MQLQRPPHRSDSEDTKYQAQFNSKTNVNNVNNELYSYFLLYKNSFELTNTHSI